MSRRRGPIFHLACESILNVQNYKKTRKTTQKSDENGTNYHNIFDINKLLFDLLFLTSIICVFKKKYFPSNR